MVTPASLPASKPRSVNEMPSRDHYSRFRFQLRGLLLPLVGVLWLATAPLPGVAAEQPVSFVNEIMPVLTKAGCNAGVCHAKAGNGQNGFQLSLLGFEPLEDFEHLVKEGRGRRLFSAAPDRSLLLLKASGQVPHGGGVRLDSSSDGYALLRKWIGQGALYDKPETPKLVSFEVQPAHGSIKRQAEQQLKALARYSDGSVRDVTGLALYESNDRAMADVTHRGLVNILDISGNVAVMVRYQGRVAVYSASIPLGAPVEKLPSARNFIDEPHFFKPEGDRRPSLAGLRRRDVSPPSHVGYCGASADGERSSRFPRQPGR